MDTYEHFVHRHGEAGVQAVVEEIERQTGIILTVGRSLEDRWNTFMSRLISEPAPTWTVVHNRDRSEVMHQATGDREKRVVLTIWNYADSPAPALANFMLTCLNSIGQNQEVLEDASTLLENLLTDGFDFSTEQAAEHLFNRINKRPVSAGGR
ncbi:hypothetical protein [Hyphomicrobium sp.]|uniref:hypothetical protein n=1 Tax=Hyphomicrobium sp. TaxID=82 RepID=UPI003567F21A